MQHSLPKLLTLAVVSAAGFWSLLRVQLSLSAAAVPRVAEATEHPVSDAPQPPPAVQSPPDVAWAASVSDTAAGLDFRAALGEATAPRENRDQLVRTAAVVPSESPAGPFGDPFDEIRPATVETAKPPAATVSPAGYEVAQADWPPVTDEPRRLESAASDADFGPDPFGPDPSGPATLPQTTPRPAQHHDDPFGAATAEPTPPAAEPVMERGAPATPPLATSPRRLLEDADPFGDPNAGTVRPSGGPIETEAMPEFGLGITEQPPQHVPASGSTVSDPPASASPPASAAPPVHDSPIAGTDEIRGTGIVAPGTPRGPQRAELTVEKSAPATAALNQPFVYEITVTNVGDCPAREVTVSDVVPRGAALLGTIPQAELADTTLVWKLNTLVPAQSVKVRVKVVPLEAGSVGSVATVNFVSEAAAATEVVAPGLSLTVAGPERVNLGRPVDFRYTIRNTGSAAAEGVVLRAAVPSGLSHPDGPMLDYEIGRLDPGRSEEVTLSLAATTAGTATQRATVTAAGGLTADAAASVTVEPPKLSVARQGPARRYVGRPAVYTSVVTNTASESSGGIKVVEQVPAGMEFVRASQEGQYDPAGRTIAWRLAPLGPGETHTLQVMLTAAAEGVQDGSVTAEELPAGAAKAGAQVAALPAEVRSETTVTGVPNLAPSLDGPNRPIAVGERASFRVVLRNRGTAEAVGVAVSVALPAGVRAIEARGGLPETGPAGEAVVRLERPLPAGGEVPVEIVLEGAAPGTARLTFEVFAGHLARPLSKGQELVVVAGR